MIHADLPDAGRTDHFQIDALLPTIREKHILTSLSQVSIANISNPPTNAQLNATFGTPVQAGAGYLVLLNDNGAGINVYIVASDGTNWWYASLTKAT